MSLMENRHILVTGAARGIGLGIAEAMLKQGAKVALADLDGADADKESQRLKAEGYDATGLQLDVTSKEAIQKAVAQLAADWGQLDVLVNNAAMPAFGSIEIQDWTIWAKVLDTNLTSVAQMSQAFLPLLKQGTNAAIVNTVSTQAMFGQPESTAYATSKGGALNLTRCMAIDLGKHNIRVNAVAPGFIDTRMALMENGEHEHVKEDFLRHYIDAGRIPLKRAGTPNDCAGAYIYLASDLSLYVTGQVIAVDGGLISTY